ncbi:MAG: thioesterase [Streptomyces sp.]|nr:thioesterase [Streptomyces sp.]
MNQRDDQWIRPLHLDHREGPRLICFPHAGGSASFFRPLATHLPAFETVGVLYPGRQDRRTEPFLEDIGALADEATAALKPWMEDRPVVFLGHSMGSVIAFEVALRLQTGGATPPLGLIASGRRAPSRHRDENVHTRGDQALIAEIRRLNGTASALFDDDEIVQMILPATRADYKAIETYRYTPGPRLDRPITALLGESDPRVTVDEARDWERHTSGAFELRTFPGGHFYLSDDWPALARAVAESIAAFDEAAGSVPTSKI